MRLFLDGQYIDDEMSLLEDVVAAFGARIRGIVEHPDPQFAKACNLDDVAEHLIGVVLVAAQNYIVTSAALQGVTKFEALDVGPVHRSGRRVVELVNHCANFWKHADEWDWDRPDKRRQAILDAFDDLSLPETSMPLVYLVSQICDSNEGDLAPLCRVLSDWRIALEETHPGPSVRN